MACKSKVNADLWSACNAGDLTKVKQCLSNGGDVDYMCRDSMTNCAIVACLNNRTEVLTYLLDNGEHNLNVMGNDGLTALMWACINNCKDCVNILLTQNKNIYLDVNLTTDDGRTALMLACATNSKDCVRLLTKHKNIYLHIRDNKNRTAACIARSSGYMDIAQIIEVARKNKMLLVSCIAGDIKDIKQALEEGADINITDHDGWTCLMHTCKTGSIKCARIILQVQHIDLDVRNKENKMAEEIARENNFMDIVQVIEIERAIQRGNLGDLERISSKIKTTEATREQLILDNERENDKRETALRKESEEKEILLRKKTEVQELELKNKYEKEACILKQNYEDEASKLKTKYEEEASFIKENTEEELKQLKHDIKKKASQLEKTNDEDARKQNIRLKQMTEDLERIQIRGEAIVGLYSPSRRTTAPECPVCMEFMTPPIHIFQCSNGHHICSNCKHNMIKCFCGNDYVGRAIDMEKFLREIK